MRQPHSISTLLLQLCSHHHHDPAQPVHGCSPGELPGAGGTGGLDAQPCSFGGDPRHPPINLNPSPCIQPPTHTNPAAPSHTPRIHACTTPTTPTPLYMLTLPHASLPAQNPATSSPTLPVMTIPPSYFCNIRRVYGVSVSQPWQLMSASGQGNVFPTSFYASRPTRCAVSGSTRKRLLVGVPGVLGRVR